MAQKLTFLADKKAIFLLPTSGEPKPNASLNLQISKFILDAITAGSVVIFSNFNILDMRDVANGKVS